MTTSAQQSTGGEGLFDPEWMSSPAGSPASRSPSPADGRASGTRDGAGRGFGTSFAHFDPDTCSWRTSQLSFEIPTLSGGCSVTWPRSGMTRSGTAYRLRPLAPITDATGSSSWPTPTASRADRWSLPSPTTAADRWADGRRNLDDAVALWPTPKAMDGERGGRGDLWAMVRTGRGSRRRDWPTPTARDWKGPGFSGQLPNEAGGHLNPMWVEWLMGFPLGWTDLGDSATP